MTKVSWPKFNISIPKDIYIYIHSIDDYSQQCAMIDCHFSITGLNGIDSTIRILFRMITVRVTTTKLCQQGRPCNSSNTCLTFLT
jgi:hypothetical protein